MLDCEIKKIIDNARDILVGKIPAPNTQVEQITLAMLYKFMDDIDQESIDIGGDVYYFSGNFEKYSWRKIMSKTVSSFDRMNLYVEALENFYLNDSLPQTFRDIFKKASVPYRDPEVLTLFLKEIDKISYTDSERLGDAYEYLLSILGSQGDLGQFRTPRHIIDFMVDCMDPKKDEKILDPACGTAGFLISAYNYVVKNNPTMNYDEKKNVLKNISGYDIEPSMVRIAEMNMYLHGCTDPDINEYDTLTMLDKWDDKYDVILANPPFFTPKGGITPHQRFTIPSRKAEVLFSEYIMEHMNRSGRSAFVVPEGIVANTNRAYVKLREKMVENGLYAVISLHQYVFKPYSGVSTLILFFNKKYKNRKEIYIRSMEEDGHEKGEGRGIIEANDIPEITDELKKYTKYLDGEISKDEIADLKGKIITEEDYSEKLDFHPNSYFEAEDGNKKPIGEIFYIEKGELQSTKREEGEFNFITASDEWLTHKTYTHDQEALIYVFGAGGSLGKVHYVNGKFITSDLCYILTPKDRENTNLLYYYAYFRKHRKELVRILARGTNKKSINANRFAEHEVLYPTKEVQDEVGKLVTTSFEKIENLKQQISDEYNKIDDVL